MAEQHYRNRVRYVIGPDGSPLTIADLPPKETKRWVIRRKAEVVAAVRGGLLSLDEACERYKLTVDEFLSWQRSIDRHGLPGLRATRVQDYRSGAYAVGCGAELCGQSRLRDRLTSAHGFGLRWCPLRVGAIKAFAVHFAIGPAVEPTGHAFHCRNFQPKIFIGQRGRRVATEFSAHQRRAPRFLSIFQPPMDRHRDRG